MGRIFKKYLVILCAFCAFSFSVINQAHADKVFVVGAATTDPDTVDSNGTIIDTSDFVIRTFVPAFGTYSTFNIVSGVYQEADNPLTPVDESEQLRPLGSPGGATRLGNTTTTPDGHTVVWDTANGQYTVTTSDATVYTADVVRTQLGGLTLNTTKDIINPGALTYTTAAGDVLDFVSGSWDPAGAPPPIPVNGPGGASRAGLITTAPDGTIVEQLTAIIPPLPFPVPTGDYRITTPDGTVVNMQTDQVSTPAGWTINTSNLYPIGGSVRSGARIQPPITFGSTALSSVAGLATGNFIFADAETVRIIFESFDDHLDPTDNTPSGLDDTNQPANAFINLLRPYVQNGSGIIATFGAGVPTADYNDFTNGSEFFEWHAQTLINTQLACLLTGNVGPGCTPGPTTICTPHPSGTPPFPPICTNAPPTTTPVPSPPPSGGAVIDTSGGASSGNWTRDALGLVFAQLFQGGEQSDNNWDEIWNTQMEPDMQNMTAQWSTAILDHGRNYGTNMDMQTQIQRARLIQEQEALAAKDKSSDLTCVVSTGAISMTRSAHASRAVSRGMAKGGQNSGLNQAGAASETGPGGDLAFRFAMYKRHFCNPAFNNNAAGCDPAIVAAEPYYAQILGGAPTTPWIQLVDGDIDLENFLFRDTIDLRNEEEKLAAYAVMRNLVSPSVPDMIPENAIDSENPAAMEAMVKRRQTEALKNIPNAVVGSIIGRRASTPAFDPGVAATLRQLRQNAGVDPAQISNVPSYNEIMLALTKERFYDKEYFARINAMTETELISEQLALDRLISVMQQDIYELQEQQSALVAARSSAKVNRKDTGDGLTEELPGGN